MDEQQPWPTDEDCEHTSRIHYDDGDSYCYVCEREAEAAFDERTMTTLRERLAAAGPASVRDAEGTR